VSTSVLVCCGGSDPNHSSIESCKVILLCCCIIWGLVFCVDRWAGMGWDWEQGGEGN
jgi:hypothetical protein